MQIETIDQLEITGPRLLVRVLTQDVSVTKTGILTGQSNGSPAKVAEVIKGNEEYPEGTKLLFMGVGTRVVVGGDELMIIHHDILEAVLEDVD